MTKQTHTPGPWEMGTKDNKGRGIIFGFNRIPVTIYDAATKDEDARLIASAPELLHLLNKVMRLKSNQPIVTENLAIFTEIEQAISKATGQAEATQ